VALAAAVPGKVLNFCRMGEDCCTNLLKIKELLRNWKIYGGRLGAELDLHYKKAAHVHDLRSFLFSTSARFSLENRARELASPGRDVYISPL
jgi:hypothetical protein